MVKEHVALERSHEEKSGGARVRHSHRAGVVCPGEIAGQELERATGGRVLLARIERQLERRANGVLAHGDDDARREDASDEWNDLLRDAAENDARVSARIDIGQFQNRHRGIDWFSCRHRLGKERFLRTDVPQDRRRRHTNRGPDLSERGLFEAARREDTSSRVEDLGA